MCGIAGAVAVAERPVDAAAVGRALTALRHRGPDDEGQWTAPEGAASIGNRRLSVIDVAGGKQPIGNEDGSIQVVVNGEIYNFAELRQELEGLGHRFRTGSDVECVAHLYEEVGDRCVERLRGMFALALWDGPRRRLLLARDRLGKKPLVYGLRHGQLVFASELAAARAAWGQDELDPIALDAFLALGSVPAPLSIESAYRKLEPASTLVLEPGREPVVRRYWQIESLPKLALSRDEARAAVRDKLADAVRVRLVSEVPLGLFLSGGVDSSAVLALMREVSPAPVRSFAIGFDDPRHDESAYARAAAEAIGAEHRELRVEPGSIDLLDQVLACYGEPYADSSCLPTWVLARLAREHVTVALTGDGGDELFAGYPRYPWLLRLGRLARWVPGAAARLAAAALPHRGRWRRAGRLAELVAAGDAGRIFELISIFGSRRRRALLADPIAGGVAGERHVADAWARTTGSALDRILATEAQTYLADDLLVKMDIATMAHGLEARSPLLDHELIELVARLPDRFKLEAGRAKALLKDAVAPSFPPGFLERPKQGFAIPLKRWLGGDLEGFFEAELCSGALARSGLVRKSEVEALLAEHRAGHAEHQHRIFALVSLSLFLGRR